MKVAIIFTDGMKQVNLTAENDYERQALEMFTASDKIQIAVKRGNFGGPDLIPHSMEVNKCQGNFLRSYESKAGQSVMFVMTPKIQE